MKQLKSITNRIALVIASFYLTLVAFAQDDTKKIDVDISIYTSSCSANAGKWQQKRIKKLSTLL
mgnify:CR=1 FL=1